MSILQAIQQAEAKAEQLRQDAHDDAKRLVEKTNQKVEKIIQNCHQ